MQSNRNRNRSITKPLLKEVVDLAKANAKTIDQSPEVGSQPLKPPALYEDAGEGYNADFIFPQD